MKNLRELSVIPFFYIVPIIPRPMSAELVKGEHFVLVDLFNSIPRSSSQVGSAKARVVEEALVESLPLDQLTLVERDPQQAL